MSTTTASVRTNGDQQAAADRDRTALALYEAEMALHCARQTQVDEWIAAASEHLHIALLAHMEAVARLRRTPRGAADRPSA